MPAWEAKSLPACTIDSMVDLIGNEVAWAVHTYDGSVKAKPKDHQISRKTSKIIDRAAKIRTICDLEIWSSYAVINERVLESGQWRN